jgi:sugar lactone lactonase YvrE
MTATPPAPPRPPDVDSASPARAILVIGAVIVGVAAVIGVLAVTIGGGGGSSAGPTTLPHRKVTDVEPVPVEKASSGALIDPVDVAVGPDGSIYVAEIAANRVRRITPEGELRPFAGFGPGGFDGDGGKADRALLQSPTGVAVGPDGSVYIADAGNQVVRRVAPDGRIRTVAGAGSVGSVPERSDPMAAELNPYDVAVAADGTLYIASPRHHRVFAIGRNGLIRTFAGSGTAGSAGDDGPATAAELNSPSSLAVGADGAVYVSDFAADVVRKVARDGTISTVASGPDFQGPDGLAIARDGTIYVAVRTGQRVMKVDSSGATAVVGTGERGVARGTPPATSATLADPSAVAIRADGSLVIAETYSNKLRTVDDAGRLVTLAGGGPAGTAGDGLAATQAPLSKPQGIGVDLSGRLFIAEGPASRIRFVDEKGRIHTLAGGTVGGGGPLVGTPLPGPTGLLVNSSDVLFTTLGRPGEPFYQVQIVRDGKLALIAGTGQAGYAGDGQNAGQAMLNGPLGLGVTADDGLLVADSGNNVIRKVDAQSVITTFAGTGDAADGPARGKALEVPLNFPVGIAVRPDGGVYVAEEAGNRIRLIRPDGTVTTYAGTGRRGNRGDGGKAVDAQLNSPLGLALAKDGSLYVVEQLGNRVRVIRPDGRIEAFAGTGEPGLDGDGGPARSALLYAPSFVAVDLRGNVYVADTGNGRVRRIDTFGKITTVAGL